MLSLIRKAAPAQARHDPAPSRLSYRMERLMLTPLIRTFLKLGVPVFSAILIVGVVVSDEDRRAAFSETYDEIRTQLANRPEFMVHAMSIDGASEALAEQIREVTALDFPVSSFDLDLEGLRKTILKLPPVAEAGLQIGTGGMLRLNVVERVPVVIWRAPDGLHLTDDEGHFVADLASRIDRPDLPLIAGEGAVDRVDEAQAILAAAEPLKERLRGLNLVGERRWDLVLDREQVIKLPEEAPIPALEQVLALDQAQDLLARDVAVIDMRTPRRPTLRLAKGAQDELRHIRVVQSGDSRE